MRRRDFVRLAGAAAIALPATAQAQFNASRPITMVVPFPAGGGADILVRLLTKYMSENFSHSIIVQNLPGAGEGLRSVRWRAPQRTATRSAGSRRDFLSWPPR